MQKYGKYLAFAAGLGVMFWAAVGLRGGGPVTAAQSGRDAAAPSGPDSVTQSGRDVPAAPGKWFAKPAPDVLFQTLDGRDARLSDHAGRLIVLNFWGTWCAPCRREIPELVELHEEYGERGVVVIGVAIESGTPEQIREYAAELGVNYPIWIGSAEAAVVEFGVIGYPFTVLVDARGIIRKEYLGPQRRETLAGALDALDSLTR